jgi:integrase
LEATVKRIKDEKRIKTPELRARLAPGRIHWEDLGNGGHLGYRRSGGAGEWLGRHYLGHGKYRQEAIGGADDGAHLANNRDVFSYFEARDRAHQWLREKKNEALGLPSAGPDLTVNDALQAYATWLEGRGGGKDVRSRAMTMIAPTLGAIKVRDLRQTDVERWLAALATTPARLRHKRGAGPRYADTDLADPEVQRRRRANANRLLSVLRASLTRCWRMGLIDDPSAWQRIRPFRGVIASRVRFLSVDEAARLVRMAEPAFGRLLQAGLVCGARFSELRSLRCSDFDANGTLYIARSKTGRSRHIVLGPEGVELFRDLTAGRHHDELILTRPDGTAWTRNSQTIPMKRSCIAAKIKPLPFYSATRHSYASHAAMNGMVLQLIARNLGHSSIAMVERHYSHLPQDYATKEIVARSPVYGFGAPKITPIGRRRA